MISRHRQVAFPSPFTPEEIELDPEKGLWVPGRKKILVPSPKMPSYGLDWAPITQSLDFQRECFRNLMLGGWDTRYCDCVPSRSEYLAQPRDLRIPVRDNNLVPVTYNDIKRSETPAFRSRPRYGVLYDRYERMIRD